MGDSMSRDGLLLVFGGGGVERWSGQRYRRRFPQLGALLRRVCADKAAPPFASPTRMLTDVSLSHGGRTLVIDAKCYVGGGGSP